MLQECNYWESRKGAVQIFFLTRNINMSAGKFVKSERLLTVLWEGIIFNFKWIEVRKIVEGNCIVKCVIFFASFCWLWDSLLENLKLRKNCGDANWNVWTNIKTRHVRSNIFKKKKKKGIPHMRFWIIYILVQFSFLVGLRVFADPYLQDSTQNHRFCLFIGKVKVRENPYSRIFRTPAQLMSEAYSKPR